MVFHGQIRFYAGISPSSITPKRGIATYGTEVEVRTSTISDAIDTLEIGNSDEFMYFMEDGSVTQGFEIATQPFTFAWMNDNRKRFDQMFRLEKDGIAESYSASECGMHIHVGRAGFVSKLHQVKFAKLFYDN